MKRYPFRKRLVIALALSALIFSFLGPAITNGGTYLSTKHGTEADRTAIGATIPYTVKGHCGQCHEQHATIGGAEPTPPAMENAAAFLLFRSNYSTYKNELCYACHETFTLSGMPLGYGRLGNYQGKTKYTASIHNTSNQMLWSPDPSPPGPTKQDQGNCNNCHNPHGTSDAQGLIPSMLFAREEALCESCHNGTQAGLLKSIKAQLDKLYKHPTHTYEGRHTVSETGQPGGSSFGPDNRHAECADCHNPHAQGASRHTQPGNAISDVLKNVSGVEPTSWPPLWTQPTSFTFLKPPVNPNGSQYEYQICFKCHSYYGLGTLPWAISSIIGPSGTQITDQAWEFNPNNYSGHPAVKAANDRPGSAVPKALTSAQMTAQWSNVGMQTMYCSDCHGADNEETSGAKGPHGSTRKYMLKGTGKYWPTKADGITVWRLNAIDGSDTNLFCKNCHPIYSGGTWKNNVHANADSGPHDNLACVECHSAVPHGFRDRLIACSTDPAPYNYNGNTSKVTAFAKTDPNSYSSANCTTVAGCHGGGMAAAPLIMNAPVFPYFPSYP